MAPPYWSQVQRRRIRLIKLGEALYYIPGWLNNRTLEWLTFRALPPEAPLQETVLLSRENVTLIVKRICHPLSMWILKGLRHGWSGRGLV
jgi:hypothetical protein